MSCVLFQGRKSKQIHVCTINNFVFSPPQSWFHEYKTLCSYRTIISKQLELSSYYWPIRYTSLLRLTAGHGFVVFVVSETSSKLHRNPLWFRCLRADYRIFPIQTIISKHLKRARKQHIFYHFILTTYMKSLIKVERIRSRWTNDFLYGGLWDFRYIGV